MKPGELRVLNFSSREGRKFSWFFFSLLGWVAVLAAREKREERRSKADGKAGGLKGF